MVAPARPRAVVVLTGSELVRGSIRDENGAFLAAELTRLGLEPERLVVVGDDPEALARALRDGLEADLCVTSGGLGPTHDDRTVELVAAASGRRLVPDERLAEEIEAFSRRAAARLGRPYADFEAGVRKQATLPEGGVSLGLAGTAPAVLLEHDRGVVVTLPGPPGELRRLWPRALEHDAVRRIVARAPERRHRLVRLFGASESSVARVLAEAGAETAGLDVTVCARDLEIQVDLFSDPVAAAAAEALAARLRDRFGEEVFAEDERPVEELVLELARRRRLTLATAESCTGGLVGARLTSVPGASDVYVGGVVSYADDAKEALLAVPRETLARYGAVSSEAAESMARGARDAFGADVVISVTGIAGPGGGTPEKPVGLVFLYALSSEAALARELVLGGSRDDVRGRAAAAALHLLRRLLSQSETNSRDFGG